MKRSIYAAVLARAGLPGSSLGSFRACPACPERPSTPGAWRLTLRVTGGAGEESACAFRRHPCRDNPLWLSVMGRAGTLRLRSGQARGPAPTIVILDPLSVIPDLIRDPASFALTFLCFCISPSSSTFVIEDPASLYFIREEQDTGFLLKTCRNDRKRMMPPRQRPWECGHDLFIG